MRTVTEYQEKVREFENLATHEPDAGLKKRYSEMAHSYRLLAQERERVLFERAIREDREPTNKLR